MDGTADLSAFGLGPMVRLSAALRELSPGCASLEDFAQRVCTSLHETFLDTDGQRQTALVRFYGTAPLASLPAAEQRFASRGADDVLPDSTTCLTLLGTAGELPQWNDRRASVGHRAIALRDPEQVARLPMVAALLDQLGVDVHALLSAQAEVLLPAETGDYRVFHVPYALGSLAIPAQDFVAEHGVAAAFGFGGALPTGEIYAVIIFSRVSVPATTARLFGAVALSTTLAALDMLDLPLLRGTPLERRPVAPVSAEERSAARVAITQSLLRVHEMMAAREADRALAALEQSRYDARRAAALANVAMQLSTARTVDAVVEVLFRDGVPVLGADGGSLALVNEDRTSVQLSISQGFSQDLRQRYAELPLDDTFPAVLTARTGEMVVLPDVESGDARFPALAEVSAEAGVRALGALPLVVDGRLIGSFTATWNVPTLFTDSVLELMEALAAQAAQAVDRARLLELERYRSETLQRSFLTRPPSPAGLDIEVRYLPAAEHAQVGGDWYDAFRAPDGSTMLTVGDVVGHDVMAAGVMGQLRSLLRGIAFARPGSPAAVLRRLDSAVAELQPTALATVLVGRLVGPADEGVVGPRLLSWSSAGHLPPMLREPGGEVTILHTRADLMIGVTTSQQRNDHTTLLQPGSTLVLYSDGLVERRHEDLDVGIARLRDAVAEHGARPLDQMCDAVVQALSGSLEDDVVLLALRLQC